MQVNIETGYRKISAFTEQLKVELNRKFYSDKSFFPTFLWAKSNFSVISKLGMF